VSSLGLQRGDQIIVNEAGVGASGSISSQSVRESLPVIPPTKIPATIPLSSPLNSSDANSVEVDGSFLVHRV